MMGFLNLAKLKIDDDSMPITRHHTVGTTHAIVGPWQNDIALGHHLITAAKPIGDGRV